MRFDAGQESRTVPPRRHPVAAGAPARRRAQLPVAAVRPDYELIVVNGSRLEIAGHPSSAPAGEIAAVSYRAELRPSAREVLAHLLDPDASVVARSRLTGGRSIEQFEASGVEDSAWSLDSATAAAAALLGEQVSETGRGAAVEAIREDTRGLDRGDVIIAVSGVPVRTAIELRAALAGLDSAEFTVQSAGSGLTSSIRPARHSDGVWGIRTVTADRRLSHGISARFDLPDDLRGPSLGLACALSVIDALCGGRLAAGGAVVATGTVDLAGRVGGVGAIEYKARAVRAHQHVRRFLVPADPASDVEDARRVLAGRAEVVAVATLAEAVQVLGGFSWREFPGNRRSRDRQHVSAARLKAPIRA